jgi:hypothetical protein
VSKPQVKKVAVDRLRVDGGTQARTALRPDVIKEYAEHYRDGVNMPRVLAFDDGENLWLADGFHRRAGAKLAGLAELECEVHAGTQRDALFWAVGCNEAHGVRRTNEDKRNAVKLILMDEMGKTMSTGWIREKCKVSADLVESVRQSVLGTETASTERRTGKDGRSYKVTKPQKEKERELGDDQEDAKTSSSEGKMRQAKYDWHELNKHLEVVARAPDAIATAYKGEKEGAEYWAAMRCLETLAKIMAGWKRRLLKEEERA